MEWCSRATISALTDLGIQRIGLKKWNTVAGGNEKKGFVNLLGSKKTPGISLSTHIHQHQQQQTGLRGNWFLSRCITASRCQLPKFWLILSFLDLIHR